MKQIDCFLTVDCGTTSSKAALVSTKGAILRSASTTRQTYFRQLGYVEQSLSELWQSVCDISKEVASQNRNLNILGLSFSGTIGDAVAIDKNLKPVSKTLILYSDNRALRQCSQLEYRIRSDTIYRISGNPLSPTSCLPKWMWLKERRSRAFRRTWKFIQPKDFLVLNASGQVCTDYTSASATMAFDIRKRNWSGRMLDAAGIDIELMPELSESAAIIGELTRSAAGKMGLFPGLPVITGAGDTGAMMLGAGAIDDGDAVLYLGGGAEVDLVTGRELLNTKMPIPVRCHVLPGRYFTSVTALASGVARNWLSDIFNYSPHNASLSFSRAARRAGVGAHGFLFLPYLLGEQGSIWDPYARGAFIGLTGSTTSSDFCRAVLESTAYSLHQILTLYKKTGLRPRRFVICGGGARNRLLSEIVTDALGVQTRLHDNAEEVAAIGTAICAAASLRRYKSLHAAANQMVHCHKRLTPKSANYEKYIRMLRLSEQAYLALRNIFHELSKFQKRDHDL